MTDPARRAAPSPAPADPPESPESAGSPAHAAPAHAAPADLPGSPARAAWIVGPHETRPDADPSAPLDAHCARWIHVSDRQEFADTAAALDPVLRAAVDRVGTGPAASHRPLAHVRHITEDWLLVMTPTIWFTEADRQVHTGMVAVLAGPDTVLTLETGQAHAYDDALDRLHTMGTVRGSGVQRVAVAVLLAVLTSASDVEVSLGDAVAETERLVFDRAVANPVTRIYELKREITEARRALLPVTAELPELVDEQEDHARAAIERRMADRLTSTVERIDRHLDAHDGLLSDMLQVHLAQVSVRQNEDMRKISAWAAILVYPTIVAGIYGMNFVHMPELHWLLGYPFALGLIAVGCVILFRVFKKAGWL